jgi:hypothetical protein
MKALDVLSPLFRWTMTAIGAVVLFAMCAAVQAQEPRQAKITFSRPAQYVDGTAIPANVTVTYRVYQGEKGQPKTAVATIGDSPATITTGLQAGKEYCWQITAIANGVESDRSNEGCKSFPFLATEAVIITVE